MRKLLLSCVLACVSTFAIAQTVVSIADVQTVADPTTSDVSTFDGQYVEIEGVVTMDPCNYALSSGPNRIGTFIQTEGSTGDYTGVHVLIDPSALSGFNGFSGTLADLNTAAQFIDNFQVGNKVKMRGYVSAFSDNTQIILTEEATSVTGISSMPAPIVTTINQFMMSDGMGSQVGQKATAEPKEGMYVQFDNVKVVNVSENNGRWTMSFQDGAGNQIEFRDVSGHFSNTDRDKFCDLIGGGAGASNTPTAYDGLSYSNASVSYVRGVVVDYGSNVYRLAPLTPSDLGSITASPPIVNTLTRDIAIPNSSENVTVTANITDNGSVVSADLYYSVGAGNMTYTMLPMTNTAGNDWTATIPAQVDGSVVNYYVSTVDNDGLVTDSPDPASPDTYNVTDVVISNISDIQGSTDATGESIYAGNTLTGIAIRGIVISSGVTGAIDNLGLVHIQDGTAEYSGIQLRGTNGNIDTLMLGDEIEITQADVVENFGFTRLENLTYSVISSGNALPATNMSLNPNDLAGNVNDLGEKYESMLVGFAPAYVSSVNPDDPSNFGEWAVDLSTGSTTGLRVDNAAAEFGFDYNDNLVLDQQFNFIQGVLNYSFSNFKLLPRNLADVDLVPVGLNELEAAGLNITNIYPNPTSDMLNVSISTENSTLVSINIIDVTGKTVATQTEQLSLGNNTIQMNLATIASGVYFAQITLEGNATATVKVVKK